MGLDELALAARNHGLLLEALREEVTPVGMHYLLMHYDLPFIDPESWRLEIAGAVATPASLRLQDLRARPVMTRRVTLECAGNGRARLSPRPVSQPWLLEAVGTAEWTGTPLAPVLREAGLAPGVVDLAFTGADHGSERGVEQDYARGLSLAEALREDVLLVWGRNGAPLPPQHGAPVRLLVPGWYGMAQVKWLVRIEALESRFTGFQNEVGLSRGGPGPARPRRAAEPHPTPCARGSARVPRLHEPCALVRPGPVELMGRAWSGHGAVTRVEVSTDAGRTWTDAEVDAADPDHPHAWQRFWLNWSATPGRHELSARAHDVAGRVQPVEPPWNRQGVANNAVQRLPVYVIEA